MNSLQASLKAKLSCFKPETFHGASLLFPHLGKHSLQGMAACLRWRPLAGAREGIHPLLKQAKPHKHVPWGKEELLSRLLDASCPGARTQTGGKSMDKSSAFPHLVGQASLCGTQQVQCQPCLEIP